MSSTLQNQFQWSFKHFHSTTSRFDNVVGKTWCHQMETFSMLLAICVGNSPVNSELPRTKASNVELWCFLWSALVACINSWVNNGEVGDLRCHHTHYDSIVMHYLNQCWVSKSLTLHGKFQWRFKRFHSRRSRFENVVSKMSTILFRLQFVNHYYMYNTCNSLLSQINLFVKWFTIHCMNGVLTLYHCYLKWSTTSAFQVLSPQIYGTPSS